MKDKERDIFDDLCRSKLQDFEADTMPGDWEAIADRLTVKKSVPFRRTLRYWVAAAVISLLVVTGGVYVLNHDREHLPVAETIQKETEAVGNRLTVRSESVTPAVAASKPVNRMAKRAVAQVTAVTTSRSDITADDVVLSPEEDCDTVVVVSSKISEVSEMSEAVAVTGTVTPVGTRSLLADAAPVKTEKKVRAKRWSFGMGGGSVSAGTSNSASNPDRWSTRRPWRS